MNWEILLMLGLIAAALVLFARETLPIEVTALALLGVLVAAGLVEIENAVLGFSNKAVIVIGSLFVLSQALMKTGFVELAASRLSRRFRHRRRLAVAILLVGVGVSSGFLNNTAIVAMTIPLALGLCARLEMSPSKLLLPLSYVSIFGGTLTLIGTSTNLLVSSVAEQEGVPPLGLFEFSRMGVIYLGVGLAYLLLFADKLLPARAKAVLTQKYGVAPFLAEVRVRSESRLLGKTFTEVGLSQHYQATVLAVLRGDERITEGIGTLALEEGDVLIVQAPAEALLQLRKELGLALLPDVQLSDADLEVGDRVMVEALVPHEGRMAGRTLKDLDFYRTYGGFVLAIRRLGGTLRKKVANIPLRFADTLLIFIGKERLEELRRSEELIVLSERKVELHRERFWWLVIAVLPTVILLAAFDVVGIATGAFLGAILVLAAGALTPQEAYRSIDWSVLFLIAAFVPVGKAFLDTGAADLLASGLLAAGNLLPEAAAPFAVLSLVYLSTSLLTQVVSNSAAAIILVPVALSASATLGVDSRPFLMAVCFAASAEFMTPMGYQTNLMVYGPGAYRFIDYVKFGAPLNLLFWLLATLLTPFFWPFNPS